VSCRIQQELNLMTFMPHHWFQDDNIRLLATFQDKLSKPVLEYLHFINSSKLIVIWWLIVALCHYYHLKGSVKESNKFHNYDIEKITRKASDTAEYIKLFGSSPEIVKPDAFNVILWTSANIMHHRAWQSRVEELNNSI